MKQSHTLDYFLIVITMFFWGLSWPITKILVPLATSFQIGFFRFIFASSIYLIIFFIKFRGNIGKYTLKTCVQFFILGLLGIFGYGILFLTALRYTTSAQGAVLAGIQPAIITILSRLIHKERLVPRWRYFGLIFSFTGVVVIVGIAPFIDFNSQYLIGNSIVVIAFLFFAAYSVYGKSVMQTHSAFETTTWAAFFGAIMFGGMALIENRWDQLQWKSGIFWISILILAIFVTVISFFCYFFVIKRIGATKTGIFINLVPVFGVLSSVILLGEKISWTLWVGLLLICVGIVLINFPLNKQSKSEFIETENKDRIE